MRQIQRNAALAAGITLIVAVLVNFVGPSTLMGRVVETFDEIPVEIGGWTGIDLDISEHMPAVPNSSLLMRDYVDDTGRSANLMIVYGLDAADIHNPEYCFEGSGWKQLNSRSVNIGSVSAQSHSARLLLLEDSEGTRFVSLYWYRNAEGASEDLVTQRIKVWKSAVTGRLRPSAVVRILVPIVSDEQIAINDAVKLADAIDNSLVRMISHQPRVERSLRRVGE